jgi:hypothetical protein
MIDGLDIKELVAEIGPLECEICHENGPTVRYRLDYAQVRCDRCLLSFSFDPARPGSDITSLQVRLFTGVGVPAVYSTHLVVRTAPVEQPPQEVVDHLAGQMLAAIDERIVRLVSSLR